MSRADEYRYRIERQRKQELDRQRVRETTRPFVERYRSLLNDVVSQGLSDVIPAEFRELSSELRRMEALLDSDPFAARDMSRSLGGRFHGLPRFAREQRRSRQEAELAAVEALAFIFPPFSQSLLLPLAPCSIYSTGYSLLLSEEKTFAEFSSIITLLSDKALYAS